MAKKSIRLRPHHFTNLILVWNPEKVKKYLGKTSLEYTEEVYGKPMAEYLSSIAKRVRSEPALKIVPVGALDDICSHCNPDSDPDCRLPDITTFYRNLPFYDLKLKFGKAYNAKKISKKLDEWVEKHPHFLDEILSGCFYSY